MKSPGFWLCAAVFVLALALALYPLVSSTLAERYQSTALADYSQRVESLDDGSLALVRSRAEAYNQRLLERDAASERAGSGLLLNEPLEGYAQELNLQGDGVMGFIRIPTLDLVLPVYHGVEGAELEKGVGHMPGSSLPVGGKGTHAVLAAHSGIASQRMFSDLDKLQEGDWFCLEVLGEDLTYQVDNIRIVEPDDVTGLDPLPDLDMVTLVTCTPYGVNTHRLLVRGRRAVMPVQEEQEQTETAAGSAGSTWREQYLFGLNLGLCLLLALVVLPLLLRQIVRQFPARRKKRRKRTILWIWLLLLFLAGLLFALWPRIVGTSLNRRAHAAVSDFYDLSGQSGESMRLTQASPAQEPDPPSQRYPRLRAAMEQYNRNLLESGQSGLCDAWSYQQPSFDLASYGVEEEAAGVLTIPALDLEMPIYLGASEENMAKGAVHLSQTSLPLGGESTNCVIAGHRGWYSAPYFRYLDKLQIGDEVRVTNLWESLTYRVSEVKIIDPGDIGQILIQPGRDLVTLVTCHPYASGGKYRYLVFCERVLPEGPAVSE